MINYSLFTPKDWITFLKGIKGVGSFYAQKVRHYTLEQHTLLVMSEFNRYFSKVDLPINKNLFNLMLALHDIGKPKAFLEGNKAKQHSYTMEIIHEIKNMLPFPEKDIQLILALVASDPIGLYMQNQITAEDAKNQIISLASQTNFSNLAFFSLMVVYYQSDTASYTADAGGYAYLEHLFEYQNGVKFFDNEKKRIRFSLHYEKKIIELENIIS